MKIQLEPGPSSAATHRLTQPSCTLNRRYVSRPTNLAIEEVAKSAAQSRHSQNLPATPSRLVNMHVHDADLAAIRAAEAEARFEAEQQQQQQASQTITTDTVEYGVIEDKPIAPQTQDDYNYDSGSQDIYNYSNEIDNNYPVPFTSPSSEYSAPVQSDSFNSNNYTPSVYQAPSASYSDFYQNSSAPAIPASINNTNDIDTKALAMNIAADYTAATLGATMNEVSHQTDVSSSSDKLSAAINEQRATSSIDEIARTASEAIASIRNATDPTDIANQISALKKFAEDIKTNSTMPEITELGNTIEKFIAIAAKSTGIKAEIATKKTTLSPKASRAAAKVTKSSAKIITSSKTTPRRTATAKVSRPATTRKISSATRPAKPVARKPAASSTLRRTVRPATRKTTIDNEDLALRRALRSVAAMDDQDEFSARPTRQPIRRKGSGKRFALAFCCAAACVAAIIYFVSTNIPDISVRVAAMQTGVDASYPAYLPSGFSLSSIDSENGKITLVFNGPDGQSFTLVEEKSSWDSTTLQRNYAEPTWGSDYTTTHEQGITVYMSGSSAAWVNGGVLHKINASINTLTKKQLRNIVTSMQ